MKPDYEERYIHFYQQVVTKLQQTDNYDERKDRIKERLIIREAFNEFYYDKESYTKEFNKASSILSFFTLGISIILLLIDLRIQFNPGIENIINMIVGLLIIVAFVVLFCILWKADRMNKIEAGDREKYFIEKAVIKIETLMESMSNTKSNIINQNGLDLKIMLKQHF